MDTKLRKWANAFRRAAQADHHEALRAHLRRFDFPDRPELLLEGTIQVVIACCAYAELDGRAVDEFLKMQGYDSTAMEQGGYIFTFDIFGKAFGRVVTSHAVEALDLADLYGHPWHDHQVVGYFAVAVGTAVGGNLSAEDLVYLERSITNDLRYDYGEDELDFWFDTDSCSGALLVHLQDQESLPDEEV